MNETHRTTWEAALQRLPLFALLRGAQDDELEARFDAAVAAGFRLIALPLDAPHGWESLERLAGRCPEGVALAADGLGEGGAEELGDAEACTRLAELGVPLIIVTPGDGGFADAAAASGLGVLVRCANTADVRKVAETEAQAVLLAAAGVGDERLVEVRKALSSSMRLFVLGLDETNMAEWISTDVDGLGFDESLGDVDATAERGRKLIAEWRRVREALIQAEMFEREGDA